MTLKNGVAMGLATVVLGCGLVRAQVTVTVTPAPGATPAPAPAVTVTLADAKADLAGGKYAECLQKIAKLMSTAPAAPAVERAEILMVKGECLLQDKQGPTAADAFSAAGSAYPPKDSKEGKDTDKNDKDAKNGKYWKQIALAEATSTLIKKSPELKYTPVTPKDKTPLPIVDITGRPAAMTALFNDELAANQTAIKPLTHGTPSLPSIVDFAPKLHDQDMLEVASTGSDAQTSTMLTDLAASAKKSIDAWIKKANTSADTASTNAAKTTETTTGSGKNKRQTTKAKGLNEGERTNLENDLGTIGQLPPWIKTLVSALNLDKDYFKQETTDSQTLKTKVQGVLAKYPSNG